MIFAERLLGYDVRTNRHEKLDWSEERKKEYLLRQNINKPLSVDKWVWEKRTFSQLDKKVNYLGFFDDIMEINTILSKILDNKYLTVIKVTIVANEDNQQAANQYFMHLDTREGDDKKKQDWLFLGYDIGDSGLISGLMNCSHRNTSKTDIKEWANALNNNHLFENFEKALAFKKYADQTIQEHAPFFVFGVYCYIGIQ